MSKHLLDESFPGSGVTNDGTRINRNMIDISNSPCLIRKLESANAAVEHPSFNRMIEVCRRMNIALGNRFQRNSSLFRKICFSIKLEREIPKLW